VSVDNASIDILAAKQVPIAVLGHPPRTGEVTFPCAAGEGGFARRAYVEHDMRDFRPIGIVGDELTRHNSGCVVFVTHAAAILGLAGICQLHTPRLAP
jgi:hypothetical protein